MARSIDSISIQRGSSLSKTAQEADLCKIKTLKQIASSNLNSKVIINDKAAKNISEIVFEKGNNFSKTKKVSARKFESHYDHYSCCGGLCGGAHGNQK